MNDVFVSYDHEDRDRVAPLVEAMEERRLSVFWDRNIPPGSTWDDVLERNLDGARCVLVVWTERSRESEWVRTEASRALKTAKLVPVRLDPVVPPLEFDRVQCADLTDWSAGVAHPGLDGVLAELGRRVRGESAARKLDVRGPWAQLAGALAASAAATVSLAWLSRGGRGLSPGAIFSLVVATLSAALAGAVAARTLALVRRNSLRPRTQLVTAGLAAAVVLAGGFVLAASPRKVEVSFHAAGQPGVCPPGLDQAQAVVELVGAPATESPPLRIDARCRTTYPAPAAVMGRSARVRLTTQRDYVLASSGAESRLDGRPIEVEVRPSREVPRLHLVLFKYQGAAQGQERFNELRGVLEDMTRSQAQTLASVSGFEYLAGLQVSFTDRDLGTAPEEVKEAWQSLHALGVLAGTVWSVAPFQVNSTVYLGDLDPKLTGVEVRSRIQPEEFDKVRKAHWAAVLYALALDARRLGKPATVVGRYLTEAREAASDIEGQAGKDLVARVDAVLNAGSGGGP